MRSVDIVGCQSNTTVFDVYKQQGHAIRNLFVPVHCNICCHFMMSSISPELEKGMLPLQGSAISLPKEKMSRLEKGSTARMAWIFVILVVQHAPCCLGSVLSQIQLHNSINPEAGVHTLSLSQCVQVHKSASLAAYIPSTYFKLWKVTSCMWDTALQWNRAQGYR